MTHRDKQVPWWVAALVLVTVMVLSYWVYTPKAAGQDRICETVCEIDGWGRQVCKTVCRDNELSFMYQGLFH